MVSKQKNNARCAHLSVIVVSILATPWTRGGEKVISGLPAGHTVRYYLIYSLNANYGKQQTMGWIYLSLF